MVESMSSVPISAIKPSEAPKTPASLPPQKSPLLPQSTPQKKPNPKTDGASPLTSFFKADLQVCRVLEALPLENSDKLFLCKLQVHGEKEPRNLVAGMAKYYSAEEFTGKLVVAVLNLKPAKLAGIVSCAMICAGSVVKNGVKEIVKLLEAPEGSEIGDRILVEGFEESQDCLSQCNDKQWKRCVTGLSVCGGVACVEGKRLVTEKGCVRCELPGGEGEIH